MRRKSSQGTDQAGGRQPIVYHDFNLRFAAYNDADGSFKVWVEGETPGGTMKPDNAVQRVYDAKAFWDDPGSGTGGLIGKLERRNLPLADMLTLGQLLSDLAVPEGEVRRLFERSLAALKAGEGLRLRLHIDATPLAQLPWEFMALPQTSGESKNTDFLALRREISIVRTDTVEAAARPLPDRPTARVVAVLSSPTDQEDLRVDDDGQVIGQAVQALNQAAGKNLIEVVWAERPATREALTKALANSTDIFHFGGHALFEPVSKEGKILLELPDNKSDPYEGAQLAQLLRAAEVRLAVLGACETGRRDSQSVWSGVAPALTREKLPAVIANQFKIKDTNAILVASMVYHRVLAQYTVDEALYEARQAIYQQPDGPKRDWGVPVLYLHDKTGVLFPRVESGRPAEAAFTEVTGRFGQVEGEVVGVEIGKVTGGRVKIKVTQTVEKVEKGGRVVGVKIDEIR